MVGQRMIALICESECNIFADNCETLCWFERMKKCVYLFDNWDFTRKDNLYPFADFRVFRSCGMRGRLSLQRRSRSGFWWMSISNEIVRLKGVEVVAIGRYSLLPLTPLVAFFSDKHLISITLKGQNQPKSIYALKVYSAVSGDENHFQSRTIAGFTEASHHRLLAGSRLETQTDTSLTSVWMVFEEDRKYLLKKKCKHESLLTWLLGT